jgi:hypothetical protein
MVSWTKYGDNGLHPPGHSRTPSFSPNATIIPNPAEFRAHHSASRAFIVKLPLNQGLLRARLV